MAEMKVFMGNRSENPPNKIRFLMEKNVGFSNGIYWENVGKSTFSSGSLSKETGGSMGYVLGWGNILVTYFGICIYVYTFIYIYTYYTHTYIYINLHTSLNISSIPKLYRYISLTSLDISHNIIGLAPSFCLIGSGYSGLQRGAPAVM
jgi:hypothetical protein